MTEEQQETLFALKRAKPFAIVFGVIDKDSGEFSAYIKYDRRLMNKKARQGHAVFEAKS